jgi:hypothetical protein
MARKMVGLEVGGSRLTVTQSVVENIKSTN